MAKIKDPVELINAAKSKISASHINKTFIGKLFLFQYDPKTAAVLPYWDRYPLVFPISTKSGSMLGVNMHYLPLTLRLRLLNNFKKLMDPAKKNFIHIDYPTIEDQSSLRFARPCIKRYLFKHFVSRLVPIDVEDWDMTIAISSLADFQKASARKVWADSTKKVQ